MPTINVYKNINNRIIFDKNILSSVCRDIIESFDGLELVKAYVLLVDLCNKKGRKKFISSVDIHKIPKLVIDEGIKNSYTEHLFASGKAKSTIKNYIWEIDRFLTYLKENNVGVSSLDPEIVIGYLSKAKIVRGLSNNTYSKVVVIIRLFLSYLYKDNRVERDLSSNLKVPRKNKKESEYLTDMDISKIEYYLGNRSEKYRGENLRNSIVFYLGIKCGLRKSEMIKLNWEDINLDDKKIKILDSKGGKDRVVYFNGKLRKDLCKYRKLINQYSGAVVRGNFGKRVSSCSIQKIIRKIYKESGVCRKGLVLHSLRHTYAENLRNKKVDMETISKLLGHSSLDTTSGYLHISNKDLKKATL